MELEQHDFTTFKDALAWLFAFNGPDDEDSATFLENQLKQVGWQK